MTTQTQNTGIDTRTTEERLGDVIEKLLVPDLDLLITKTAGAYVAFASGLSPDSLEGDEVYNYQNVIEFLLILKDIKAKYGDMVDISLKKHQS